MNIQLVMNVNCFNIFWLIFYDWLWWIMIYRIKWKADINWIILSYFCWTFWILLFFWQSAVSILFGRFYAVYRLSFLFIPSFLLFVLSLLSFFLRWIRVWYVRWFVLFFFIWTKQKQVKWFDCIIVDTATISAIFLFFCFSVFFVVIHGRIKFLLFVHLFIICWMLFKMSILLWFWVASTYGGPRKIGQAFKCLQITIFFRWFFPGFFVLFLFFVCVCVVCFFFCFCFSICSLFCLFFCLFVYPCLFLLLFWNNGKKMVVCHINVYLFDLLMNVVF